MFGKVLIANRGEIAVRVIRACRARGIRSVAIYSQADRDALHVRFADEAHCCGPARATESYLDAKGIVEIARRAGVDAVHPGYGFLSENAAFAEAVEAAGIRFIGPSPDVIREMGQKIAARARMIEAGVPVVPGGERLESLHAARQAAAQIGYPVLLKASAGGGGRGMRRVDDESGLEAALERASSEAEAAFGDGAVYLEKCLIGPRHIEIQVLADRHGHTIHLAERECSIQRRHQKLIEEAPAHGMTPDRRAAMGEAAVKAARAVDYVGAGTVEFLVDARGEFFFLEMNTRIQVEHPVTEAVTGVDLVDWQLRIADDEALDVAQQDVAPRGHAIEARIYAEDPEKGFVPSPGPIVGWSAPSGPGIRLDAGFEGGQSVTPHYDPMIAKLVASGSDRAQALARLAAALEEYAIAGIRTSLPFLRRTLESPVFLAGAYDTSFVEAHMSEPPPPLEESLVDRVVALVAIRAARDDGDVGTPDRPRVFSVALPRSEAVECALLGEAKESAPDPDTAGAHRVRIEGREQRLVVSGDASLVAVRTGDELVRMTIVARKKGGFDVGLRDRVLKVKCEEVRC